MKKNEKQRLKSMSKKQLQEELTQKHKEIMSLEMRSRGYMGDLSVGMSTNRVGNTKESNHGKLRLAKKEYAVIKTFLNMKLQ